MFGWAAASLGVLAAGALLVAGEAGWLARADAAGLALADALRDPRLDRLFRALTWLGSLTVLAPAAVLIAAVGALRRRPPAETLLVPLALAGAALLAYLCKWLVARPRPELHASLIPLPAEAAYPSGHAMQAVAFALAVLLVWRPRAPVARGLAVALVAGLALAVLASRVYLQVHFPSDVVFGALAAACWVLAVAAALRPAGRRGLSR